MMKTKVILASLALFITLGASSLYAQDCKTPYIEVSGKCEKYVSPDEIQLSIVINEKDYAKKQSLEELEKDFIPFKNLNYYEKYSVVSSCFDRGILRPERSGALG